MKPTPEQILSFLDKANEIRDIHEVLPSDDPEARNKAIAEVFYERFVDLWISVDNPPPINKDYGESKEYLICHGNKWVGLATYNTEGEWLNTENRGVTFPTHYRELPEPPKNF